jgi:hypothetical protein
MTVSSSCVGTEASPAYASSQLTHKAAHPAKPPAVRAGPQDPVKPPKPPKITKPP